MELQQTFGTNVRNHRKSQGLTQEALAEVVGVSIETIGKIERGVAAPTFSTAQTIANALNVEVTLLFGNEGQTLSSGERGRLVSAINRVLAQMNNDELAKSLALLQAFKGK
ncbi:helix-turn-helix domain-containing protein [Maritalea myrionectae]|uniref:helix-turn-helix domain-containing protein n=1 Tax=Maritalea myrionectae TaxID=454601 RepID=UPI00042A9006|nr:helix-turn-helix transcriptional regulator [Maritalea myrionectae]